MHWEMVHQDPYPLLIAFGCILFAFWTVTGVIGICAKGSCACKMVSATMQVCLVHNVCDDLVHHIRYHLRDHY